MQNLKQWYMRKYPSDELGEEIRDNITSIDVWVALNCHQDLYSVLGDVDSVVRERIFEKMSRDLHCKYDDIYNLWLN